MKNNLIFCHNHGAVSVVPKKNFFCQNHGVVNVVAISRQPFFFQDHGVVNVVLKWKKKIFVRITYVVNVVATYIKKFLRTAFLIEHLRWLLLHFFLKMIENRFYDVPIIFFSPHVLGIAWCIKSDVYEFVVNCQVSK